MQGHPDAKIFRARPLSFSDEMKILFGGTQVRGEDAWTPSSGSFPEDLIMQTPSQSPDICYTQNDVQQETCEDMEIEEVMANMRRKRPGPSQRRKDAKNSKIDVDFEHLVTILEEERMEEERRKKKRGKKN